MPETQLEALGFQPLKLEPGTAELGFLIPRDLFQNTLGGFSIELKQIDWVVGWFSEAVNGEREAARLDQLSTSDPTVLIGAATDVVLAIGGTITFLLATYKKIVDIKEVRERTRGLKIANDAALKPFDDHITKVVNDAFDQKVRELLPSKGTERDHEVEEGLRWAMRYMMSRFERGMKVEVRFLPPLKSEDGSETPGAADREPGDSKAVYDQLAAVQQDLLFNVVNKGEPVLALEPPATKDPAAEKGPARKRTRKPKDDAK